MEKQVRPGNSVCQAKGEKCKPLSSAGVGWLSASYDLRDMGPICEVRFRSENSALWWPTVCVGSPFVGPPPPATLLILIPSPLLSSPYLICHLNQNHHMEWVMIIMLYYTLYNIYHMIIYNQSVALSKITGQWCTNLVFIYLLICSFMLLFNNYSFSTYCEPCTA